MSLIPASNSRSQLTHSGRVRALFAEGVQAARFGKTLDQRVGLRIQKQHMHIRALLPDLLQQGAAGVARCWRCARLC